MLIDFLFLVSRYYNWVMKWNFFDVEKFISWLVLVNWNNKIICINSQKYNCLRYYF